MDLEYSIAYFRGPFWIFNICKIVEIEREREKEKDKGRERGRKQWQKDRERQEETILRF